MRRLAAFLAVAAVGACYSFGVNEGNFWGKYAEAQCDFAQRCYAVYFYYNYDDFDECAEEFSENYEDYADSYEDCDFDQEKAEACLAAMGSDCKTAGEDLDDLFEDCNEIWDCGDVEYDDTGWYYE